MITLYLQLFWTFFVIGAFTIGGGYAMLSLIQHRVVVEHAWLSDEMFTDIVAISQMTPGPIGINSATYIGYSVLSQAGAGEFLCVLGSFTATLAVVLPSFLIMMLIVKMYTRLRRNNVFSGVMGGLRPAVVGLIGAAALILMTKENFPDIASWIIFAVAFIAAYWAKANAILVIVCAGIIGAVIY